MDKTAPANVLGQLQEVIERAGPLRLRRHTRYDAGHVFEADVAGVCPAHRGRAVMTVEKFVGGGFAGQVYRVRLDRLDAPDGPLAGLEAGRTYAVKIIIPPSRFALRFRNAIYALAYQGPFSAQVHPAAARSGVLWQKLIRRAAEIEFGRPDAVCDTYATFYDEGLGAWGEINEWVDGRNWHFELNEHVFDRRPPDPSDPNPDFAATGAPEYYAKKHFMARLVWLLHRVGAPELARQYEWWTAKSQPNVLKRNDSGDGPADGLCAIDFRAGLALLPFLPMSPADVKLIFSGLRRGALVQFDRGNIDRLEAFANQHADRFEDLRPALEELRQTDAEYRASLIDVTHHGLSPMWRGRLRRSIRGGFIHGWRARHLIDDAHADRLRRSPLRFGAFFALGLLGPLLLAAILVAAVPVWARLFENWGLTSSAETAGAADGEIGASTAAPLRWLILAGAGAAIATLVSLQLVAAAVRGLRRLWGDETYRRHVAEMLRSPRALVRAVHARQAEILTDWHRAGRRRPEALVRLARSAWRFWPQAWTFGRLPAKWHRFLLEWSYAWQALKRTIGGMILFMKDADFRQRWLEDIIDEGHREGALSDEEYATLRPQAADPYIKTYLLCLGGHIATAPITQLVALVVAIWAAVHYGWTWEEAWAYGLGIMAGFQMIPISPGSFCRGLVVVAVMIKKRNFRDFRVAAALSMVKYLGYLAFPIQMAATYPALSRLMAGRWARGAVRFIPVFGEHGALLEHGVLDLCFNKPVSVRQRIVEGKETAFRLVGKILLAIEWLLLTAVSGVLVLRLGGQSDAVSGQVVLRALIPSLAAAAALVFWMFLAPRFARVRRSWWLFALLTLLPVALAVAGHWQTIVA